MLNTSIADSSNKEIALAGKLIYSHRLVVIIKKKAFLFGIIPIKSVNV
jgi:hypothetical protein